LYNAANFIFGMKNVAAHSDISGISPVEAAKESYAFLLDPLIKGGKAHPESQHLKARVSVEDIAALENTVGADFAQNLKYDSSDRKAYHMIIECIRRGFTVIGYRPLANGSEGNSVHEKTQAVFQENMSVPEMIRQLAHAFEKKWEILLSETSNSQTTVLENRAWYFVDRIAGLDRSQKRAIVEKDVEAIRRQLHQWTLPEEVTAAHMPQLALGTA